MVSSGPLSPPFCTYVETYRILSMSKFWNALPVPLRFMNLWSRVQNLVKMERLKEIQKAATTCSDDIYILSQLFLSLLQAIQIYLYTYVHGYHYLERKAHANPIRFYLQ